MKFLNFSNFKYLTFKNFNLHIFVISYLLFVICFPASASAATMKIPSSTGLVGYWSFNDGAGTKAGDSSGNGLTGTLNGAAGANNLPQWITGKLGKALSFDGTDDSVSISDNPLMDGNSFTFSAWVYSNSIGTEQLVFSNDNGSIGWHLEVYNSRVIMQIYPGGTWTYSTNPLTSNTWYHIAVTYNSGSVTYYLNGAQNGTASYSYTVPTGLTKYIGLFFSGAYPWNGKIDDVRFYNRALSATEIKSIYQSSSIAQKVSVTSNLVGYWPLNEGAGTKADDVSGNSNTGSLVNSPAWTSGKLGKALFFNGGTSRVTIPNTTSISLGGAYTTSLWFKTTTANRRIMVKENSGNPTNYSLQIDGSGYLSGGVYDGTHNPSFSNTSKIVTDGLWHHAVLVRDGVSKLYVYVDNVPQSVTDTTVGFTITDATASVILGMRNDGTSQFVGSIDDFRIYNRALSATEIYNLYKLAGGIQNVSTNNFLTSGLTGLFSFDGKDMNWLTGTVFDRSVSGNNGVLTNMSTTSSPVGGKLGQALSFNGSSNYINGFYNFPYTSNFTVSTWVYPRSQGGLGTIFSTENGCGGANNGWSIYAINVDSSNFYFQWGAGNANNWCYKPGNNHSYNNWYHVVGVVLPSGKLRLYVNGVMEWEIDGSYSAGCIYTIANGIGPGDNYTFGKYPNGGCGGRFLNGRVDDSRVYNRALSDQEIKQLYNAGR